MNIFVAGLPYDLDDAELMEIFEKFGQVVRSLETASTGLSQVNGSGGRPTDSATLQNAINSIAKGSGVNGTFRTVDYFGIMSGLPYDFKKASDSIKSLQSSSAN